MADNFNLHSDASELDKASGLDPSNPAMTYVNFANSMAENANRQKQQEQQVAAAALLQKQKQEAADKGINPNTKGYMTKDEAIALINAELSRQKLLTPEIKDQLAAWYDAAPNMVEAQDVKDFVSKYQPKGANTTSGQPYLATAADAHNPNKKDENGDALVPGQSYQAHITTDPSSGEILSVDYVSGGGENKAVLGGGGGSPKDLSDLDSRMTKFIQSQRGNSLTNVVNRAKSALTLLQPFVDDPSKKPSPQILKAIEADIGSIMTGGVATVDAMAGSGYHTIFSDLDEKLGYYTGKFTLGQKLMGTFTKETPLSEVLKLLHKQVEDLRETAANTVKTQLESLAPAFKDKVGEDKFNEMLDAKMKVVDYASPVVSPEAMAAHDGASTVTTPQPGARKPLNSIFG